MPEVIKLGRKGQLSIPSSILKRLGLEGDSFLIADTAEDGSIVLRPAGVYPIESYSDDRLVEFEAENRMNEDEQQRVEAFLRAD